ncbi:uncharacterized protein [Haliotis asinina]|uniref:uncharacterized protein isoform X2 n=1 Tax=Haliotis asinina TaxID=109174 RepID=UPI003531C5AC
MFHPGLWLSLLAFPVVGAVVTTGQLRIDILNNCDTIFQNTASLLCRDPRFIPICTNFFVMAEICRWTRCGFIPQYPDAALEEVVELRDIAGYQTLVNSCGTSVTPLCRFARTILTLAQQCNSVPPCQCVPSVLCNPGQQTTTSTSMTTSTTSMTTTSMTTTSTTSMTTSTSMTTTSTTPPVAFTCVVPGVIACVLPGSCLVINQVSGSTCPGTLTCCFIAVTG